MKRNAAILAIVLIAYVGYYTISSTGGYYRPIAFGSYQIDGKVTIASKNLGEVWVPYARGHQGMMFELVFAPLVFMDRLIWHKKKAENGDPKLFRNTAIRTL